MQHYKRFISLLLVIVLSMTLSVSAFAAESETPTNSELEKHTIEFVLDPESSSDDNSITPYIWGEKVFNTNDSYTTTFPERYLGFEYVATDINGNPCSTQYNISLTYYGSIIIKNTDYANGEWHKEDWIEVNVNRPYTFTFSTAGNVPLKLTLTYYTWA